MPREKSDLNARITRTIHKNTFRVENIIFESLPGRHVTANLYIPEGKGPFPAALVLCGHFADGKVSYQQMGVLFAQNGIAALVVDPLSQGERLQLTDSTGAQLVPRATTEHTILNAGSTLVGTTIAAAMVWDNTRAIDYLETRSDIDKNRIGCMGSSGGGTQTTFLMAFDRRIKVAAISSFMTRRDRQLEVFGPDDGCQFIHNEGREHLELADYAVVFAPKPLLLMASTFDFVDYRGTCQSFDELKRVYSLLRSTEKVAMFSVEGGHGLPRPERESAVTWFRRWLCEIGRAHV
jgi:cephalosporin-C deacetylase-like acetyl esterase